MTIRVSLFELVLLVLLGAAAGYGSHYLLPPAPGRDRAEPLAERTVDRQPELPPGLSVATDRELAGVEPGQEAESVAALPVAAGPPAPGAEAMPDFAPALPEGMASEGSGLDPDYEAYLAELHAAEDAEDVAEGLLEPEPEAEDLAEEASEDEDDPFDPEAYEDYLAELAEQAEDARFDLGVPPGPPPE